MLPNVIQLEFWSSNPITACLISSIPVKHTFVVSAHIINTYMSTAPAPAMATHLASKLPIPNNKAARCICFGQNEHHAQVTCDLDLCLFPTLKTRHVTSGAEVPSCLPHNPTLAGIRVCGCGWLAFQRFETRPSLYKSIQISGILAFGCRGPGRASIMHRGGKSVDNVTTLFSESGKTCLQ